MKTSIMAGALALTFSATAVADDSLARYDSGFGVHPVANTGVVNTRTKCARVGKRRAVALTEEAFSGGKAY